MLKNLPLLCNSVHVWLLFQAGDPYYIDFDTDAPAPDTYDTIRVDAAGADAEYEVLRNGGTDRVYQGMLQGADNPGFTTSK